MALTQDVVDHTAKWMGILREDWQQDIPMKIHVHQLDAGGTPGWSPDFKSWVDNNDERRYRLTKAMRRLRKLSIREFEVAYRMIVLGERAEHTMAWLNERAIKNDKPERYSLKDTVVIIVAATDKLLAWY